MKKYSNIKNFSIVIIFIICFYFCSFLQNYFLLQAIILLFFFHISLYTIRCNNLIILLFLISLFTFQYGRIVLLPFVFQEKITISWFRYYEFSKETIVFIYELLFYNLIGIYLGTLIYKNKFKLKETSKKINNRIPIYLILILLISFVFFLINNISYALFLKKNFSYVDIYINIIANNNNVFIRSISAIFYPLLIILFSYFTRNKKINFLLCFLLLISGLCFTMIGARNHLISAIFFIIYYLLTNFNIRLKIKHIIYILLLGLILIFFSQYYGSYRLGHKLKEKNSFVILKTFIYEQGITGTYLGLLKDEPKLFERKIPYIFSSITGEKVIQNEEGYEKAIRSKNMNIGTHLSARANKNLFLNGAGMGGNYILEMYDFGGKYGIIILSLLHTYISLYLFNKINKFKFFSRIVLVYILLNGYFFIPRGNYLPNIFSQRFLYIVILYFMIKIIKTLFKERKI